MLSGLRILLNKLLQPFGLELRRLLSSVGHDPLLDLKLFVNSQDKLVIFDVGANVGQSSKIFIKLFKKSAIHSFEPSTEIFQELQNQIGSQPHVILNNFALGSVIGSAELIENTTSDMSSILPPGTTGWGSIKQKTKIQVRTVDDYCLEKNIRHIDILKMDTQGFEYEVLKGAEGLLANNQVHLIATEIIFSEMYQGLPRYDKIFTFLAERGFRVISFYPQFYKNNRLNWTDVLFINDNYKAGNR